MHKGWFSLTLALTLVSTGAFALELGDPAPELSIAQWVKGEPVTMAKLAEEKKVVVVEFWATYCPPCRVSVPHLTEWQKEFKDNLVIVGVSAEAPDLVQSFVTTMGDKMDYRVTVDDAGKTSRDYMVPFRENTIPHAFVVDASGKLVYHNNPGDPQFLEALKKIIAGDFDYKAAASGANQEKQLQKQFEDYLMGMAGARDEAATKKMGAEVYEVIKDKPEFLFTMGYRIVFWEAARYRDLELAVKALNRAAELTANKEPAILAVQAGAYYKLGDAEKGKTLEAKALEIAPDEKTKQGIKSELDKVRPKS